MAILPSDSSYQKILLTNNITLYWPFYTPEGEKTMTDIMDIEPDQNGWSITLPDASLAGIGSNFLLNNISIHSFKLLKNDGVTEITTIAGGEVKFINLTDNSTINGTWSVFPFGSGQNAITSLTATSSDASVLITDGSVVPPGGVMDFRLNGLLTNLIGQSSSGFPVITEYPEWEVRNFVAGSNIEIANPDGKFGNPVIDLNSALTGLTSLEVGDVTMSGSIITSNIVNGDIDLVTNGTGKANLNGVTIDVNNNIANINDLTVNGKFSNPLMPSAWCVFTDTVTGSNNTIVNQASENVAGITGSNGSYVITFTNAMSSINYGIMITLGSNGSSLPPPVYHGFFTVRETTSATIAILDASGEFVQDAPDGVTVVVMDK